MSTALHTYSYNPTHTTCYSEPAGCQGGDIWKPGWHVGVSKHPKTPVSSPGGPGNLGGSCTAVLHGTRETAGPERVVCVLGGAKCVVPHFSCMSPNSQLHTPVPHQHQAILSRLSPASWEMLGLPGEGRREPLFRGTRIGAPLGYLTGALC